jgi:hypothetical protein
MGVRLLSATVYFTCGTAVASALAQPVSRRTPQHVQPVQPGQAYPAITLVTRAGTTVTLVNWANDKHPDFDPVYAYLLGLCRAKGELFHEGAYEWKWRPSGF